MKRILSIQHSSWEWLLSIILIAVSYFAPIGPVILVMLAAISLDFISGIVVAYKKKEGWQSRKAWRTVHKFVWALLFVMLSYSIEKEFKLDKILWLELKPTKIVAGVICAFELWSILENAAKITDHPAFRFLQRHMKKRIEAEVGEPIEEMEEV